MLTFLVIAVIFTVIVVGLFMHHRVVEGARSQIQRLENEAANHEHEKLRLKGRLDACEHKLSDLESQLEESEQARRDLASQLRKQNEPPSH